MRLFCLALLTGILSLNVVCAAEKNEKCKKKKHSSSVLTGSCDECKKKKGNRNLEF